MLTASPPSGDTAALLEQLRAALPAASLIESADRLEIFQTDMLVGTPDAGKWPGLVAHYEMMKADDCFARNEAGCDKMMAKFVPEKFDLG